MDSSQYDGKSFSEKYKLYGDMLYRLSMVYLRNQMDSEDVMQDSFMKLLTKAPDFKSSEHEKRWLLSITINGCKNKLKEKWRRNRKPLDEDVFILDTEEDHNLAELILNLPSKIKAPIHLYYFEGYKVSEISQILNISVSAVKMRLKRGRETLRLELEKDGY